MFQSLFSFATKQRSIIIRTFYTAFGILFFTALYGMYGMYYQIPEAPLLYRFGVWTGRVGLTVYILTVLPGIFRRFSWKHKGVMILMMYRRHIGILSFLFVFNHFWIVRGVNFFFRGNYSLPPLDELMGMIAYYPLFAMFLTSNNVAVRRLGDWWNRLHKLTYIVVWFVFLHVALQRFSVWTIIAGITAISVVLSFLYARKKNISQRTENI